MVCLKSWHEPDTMTDKWSLKSWMWWTLQKWAVSLKTTYINFIFRIKTMTHADLVRRNPFFFFFLTFLATWTPLWLAVIIHYVIIMISLIICRILWCLFPFIVICLWPHFKLRFTQTLAWNPSQLSNTAFCFMCTCH